MRLDEIKLNSMYMVGADQDNVELTIFFDNKWHSKGKRFIARFHVRNSMATVVKELRKLANEIEESYAVREHITDGSKECWCNPERIKP
jgi:hypothetical protein